jgi:hypothetical protein
MSNDYIGWFSALKHILRGHASMWSELGEFLLNVSGVILCNMNAEKFGVSSCTCASYLQFFCFAYYG